MTFVEFLHANIVCIGTTIVTAIVAWKVFSK